eukprot:g15490.t1
MPTGYIRSNVTGFLECAAGWWGSASSYCSRQFPGCEIVTELYGCYELHPCAVPEIDSCVYDYSPSLTLWGGESATIQCQRWPPRLAGRPGVPAVDHHFSGSRVNAFAQTHAQSPRATSKRGLAMTTGSAQRATRAPLPFFAEVLPLNARSGFGVRFGTKLERVQEVPKLVGCTRKFPCAPLNLTSTRCDVELTGCEKLLPGQSCTVGCAPPYTVKGVTGELDCVLESCNATDVIPWGYVKTHRGWKCGEGYAGTPQLHCSFSPAGSFEGGRGCGFEMHPTGCKVKVPCVPPASLEGCKYDTSQCGSVTPGAECQLKCRKPYSGLGVFATCPDDNTDPEQEVILLGSFLDCDCPDPAAEFIPAGYVKREGEWVCGPGFAGTALKRQRLVVDRREKPSATKRRGCERPDTCLEEPEFLGCLPLQPCVIPEVDTCMFDLSDCINVMPSEICQISCVPPYKQQLQNATCRPDNTDPLQPIEWEAGRCELDWEDCVDPLPLPMGYEKAADGFHCAPGYVGVAQASPMVHCGPWLPCDATPKLTGCFPLEACRPVRFDDCAYDASQCPDDFQLQISSVRGD